MVFIVKTIVLAITVAIGNIIKCDVYTSKFKWFMQHEFLAHMRLLMLGMCDIVLEVDWLRIFSSILFDFIKIKLSFFLKKKKKIIELKEIVEEASLQMVSVQKIHKNLREVVCGYVGQLFSLDDQDEGKQKTTMIEVETLLEEYHVLFQELRHLQ